MNKLILTIVFLVFIVTLNAQSKRSPSDSIYIMGLKAYKAGNFDQAESHYQSAIKLNNNKAERALGKLYLNDKWRKYNVEFGIDILKQAYSEARSSNLAFTIARNMFKSKKYNNDSISNWFMRGVEIDTTNLSKNRKRAYEMNLRTSNTFHQRIGASNFLLQNNENKNYKTAFKYYSRVRPQSMVADNIGLIYFNGGYGMKKNSNLAYKYFNSYTEYCNKESTPKYERCKKDPKHLGAVYRAMISLHISTMSDYSEKDLSVVEILYRKCLETGYSKCEFIK